MKISEVRVKLVSAPTGRGEKLRAFASITLDSAFVVRDLRIIEGNRGLFVAMPSRKLTTRCPHCGSKNAMRSRFCNECGKRLPAVDLSDEDGPSGRRLYADVAHPIHARARDRLQTAILGAYEAELEASKREGYVPTRFDDMDYDDDVVRPSRRKKSAEGEARSAEE